MKDRFDNDVPATPEELALLTAVKALFASKGDYGQGAEFRLAFVAEAMDGYCDACGRGGSYPCYCTRDD
jgi:hypothetical protein